MYRSLLCRRSSSTTCLALAQEATPTRTGWDSARASSTPTAIQARTVGAETPSTLAASVILAPRSRSARCSPSWFTAVPNSQPPGTAVPERSVALEVALGLKDGVLQRLQGLGRRLGPQSALRGLDQSFGDSLARPRV